MAKTSTIVLAATAIEITRDPIGSNVTEVIPYTHISGVYGLYNKKPSNAEVSYSTPTAPFAIGDNVVGNTSGATGTVVGFKGTGVLLLSNVVGQFVDGEQIIVGIGYSGAGTSAGAGAWNNVTGATSGSGTGILFDVQDTLGTYDIITIVDPGVGYEIGDTITILGTDLGGATPANDLVITITGDGANLTADGVSTSYDGEWQYRFPTMTVLDIHTDDGKHVRIELQEVSNQATWNLGTLAALETAKTAIQALL